MHECENKLVTLKTLLPLAQESHQAAVTFFSFPLLQHGSIHRGQPLVFKPCRALTIAQPASSVGQCGSCTTGSRSCFIYTEQICCSLQWEVLRLDKRGIITQKLLASFSVLRALSEATHAAVAGVGWGCTQEALASNPMLSYSACLAALLHIEAILLQIFLSWHHRHLPG